MAGGNDPRIFFAAERTLLAWVRTGLTVIGLGFVVARFNLFLRMVRQAHDEGTLHISTFIGIGLVLLGSAAVAMAAWQHAQFTKQLADDERPHSYLTGWSVWFAGSLSAIGVLLAIYIAIRANPV